MKSPRPKDINADDLDIDGEVIATSEEGSGRGIRAHSPIPPQKHEKPTRRKSFFGSLLKDMDSSFVHTATEVALDFLYPMRKIDKRYNHR